MQVCASSVCSTPVGLLYYVRRTDRFGCYAFIDHGQIVALDTPAALKRMVGEDQVCLSTSAPHRAATLLEQHLGQPVYREDDSVCAQGRNGQALAADLIRQLTLTDIDVRGVNVTVPTLEEVFVHLTGRAIRDESA